MPASLPGDTLVNNLANPNAGLFVTFDPMSGPKGSPLDAKKPNPAGGAYISDVTNLSTGGLSTGIGFGAAQVIGVSPANTPVDPQYRSNIYRAGYNDAMVPGEKQTLANPPPIGVASANVIDSTMLYIGGGKEVFNGTLGATGPVAADIRAPYNVVPYTAGLAIVGAGQGGSRDGGAGPAFTGFPLTMETAAAGVAVGAVVEVGRNRSGVALLTGQSVFASAVAQLAAPA